MIKLIAVAVSLAGMSIVLYLLFGMRQKTWDEMTYAEQKRKKILLVSGTTIFLTGLLATLFLGKKKKF
jgi:hypothetical protein